MTKVEFTAYGANAAELEDRARIECRKFFNGPNFDFVIEAKALQLVSGDILNYEGHVTAKAMIDLS